MRKRSGAGLIAVTVVLAVMGLALRRWELGLACLPLVFFSGAAWLSSPHGLPDFNLRRTVVPDVIQSGGTADVTLEITNQSDRNAGILETLEELPPTVQVTRGVPHHMFTLAPFETKLFKYTVKPHQLGEVPLGKLKVRCRDQFHQAFEEMKAGEGGKVRVMRRREDARKLKLLPAAVHRPFGQHRSRFKGSGSEFFGLREYVSTDPFRIINWKASARLDRLVSREYEDERTGDVVLVVDLRPGSLVGTGIQNTHDVAISGSIAVAEHVLTSRNRLTLLFVRSDVGVLPGITSRRHLEALLQREELPDTPSRYPITYLSWLVRRALPSGAQVVALTPLIDDFFPRILEEIAGAGYRVLVVSPAPYSGGPPKDNVAATKTARELLETRRINRLLRLRRTMTAVDWDYTAPLALPLKKLGRVKGGAAWRGSASRR